ncbi:MAG: hypothetical protein IH623_19105 [Verrucomicrobia bacterium]|nr:hypothetical protein [Verrucomicrobiota bacterium]
MKRLLLSSLVGLALLPRVGVAADALYLNNGTVFNPQVDAINFVNRGLFRASGNLPYETWSTRNFTNTVGTFSGSGVMIGSPGFRFSTTSTANGMRTMASSFFNDNGAVVEAVDTFPFFTFCEQAAVGPSFLLVSASNIVVKAGTAGLPKASLIVGANGLMELTGKKVDISRAGLQVLPVWNSPPGSANDLDNGIFLPDVAITDLYWGRADFTEDDPLFSGGLWNGAVAVAQGGPFPAVQPGGDPGFVLFGPEADSYIRGVPGFMATVTVTNVDGSTTSLSFPTNITKGAVFVGASAGSAVQIGFTPSTIFNNFFSVASMLISVQVTNEVTQRMEPAYMFLQDRLASGGTTGLLANVVGCPAVGSRPANYLLTRLPFSPGGAGNNGYPEADFFLSAGSLRLGPNVTNVISDAVTNTVHPGGAFSSYGAFADNVVSRPLPVPGGTVTNLSGKIRISSDSLDMGSTRLRGEGHIIIQSSHLIASSNAVVDCENLSFNLASTNGNLRVQNLSRDASIRFRGQIRVWSATWSNAAIVLLDNYVVDTNGVATPEPITNTVSIGFQTLMVDATQLGAFALPVTVHGFTARSTNVVISDNMSVAESFLIDGRSLTINGNLTIPGGVPVVNPIIGSPPPGEPLQNWAGVNAPNLQFFTNNGTFSIFNEAHFGDDRPRPYSTFVNTGTIEGWSLQVNSDYLQNSGTLLSLAALTLQTPSGKFENGASTSGGDSQFLGGSLKFSDYQMIVNGGLYFRATNALFDGGGSSSNLFRVQNGFNLQMKPQTGDLLGTTFETVAPDVPSVAIEHTWAGEDRGPTAAGYTNNTAMGRLIVSSLSRDPFFYFAGTGAQNGLYVDELDLTALGANYRNRLAIDPSLVIYFAAAKLGVGVVDTNGLQTTEEYLDGQFDNRLRWVSDFAGPNSSVDVLVNGTQTIKVNRALRFSKLIDSDGDGIPNFFDFTPFDDVLIASIKPLAMPSGMQLSWPAVAGTVYQVEYQTNFNAPWRKLLTTAYSSATNGICTVIDTNGVAGSSMRLYRVMYTPAGP